MGYFDGVNFIGWGGSPVYNSRYEATFGNYYGIQYNHSGKLYCAAGDAVPQYVCGAYAFVTFPGMRFRYGPEEGESRYHLYVCFNGPRVDRYLESGLLTPQPRNPLIKITRFDQFFLLLNELHKCLECKPQRYERAVNLLEGLLLQLREEGQTVKTGDSRLRNAFSELAGQISTQPGLDWDFRREAEILHLSYPHFRRLFSRFLGCAPGQYLLRRRLDAAAEMLCRSELTIAEIAERNFFCDVHHFSKLFHKYFLLPPARFRQEFKPF